MAPTVLDRLLAGICAGLPAPSEQRRPVSGVAVYAAWEATSRDWQTWTEWDVASDRR